MPERYGFGGLQESETMARSDSLDLFAPEPVEGRTLDRSRVRLSQHRGSRGRAPFKSSSPQKNVPTSTLQAFASLALSKSGE